MEKILGEYSKKKAFIQSRAGQPYNGSRSRSRSSSVSNNKRQNYLDTSKRKQLLEIADEIEKSKEKCIKASHEKSSYKKFVSLKLMNNRNYQKWNALNKRSLRGEFRLNCSCCKKTYKSYLAENKNIDNYVDEKTGWLPKKKSFLFGLIQKSEFDNLRKRMYYKKLKEIKPEEGGAAYAVDKN